MRKQSSYRLSFEGVVPHELSGEALVQLQLRAVLVLLVRRVEAREFNGRDRVKMETFSVSILTSVYPIALS